jgi:acetyl-CoA C-acetyltransferase
MTQEAMLYATLRTPRGRGRESGALHPIAPVNLLAGLLRNLRERTGLETGLVDDLIIGCVTPVGEQGADIARTAALVAGWHQDVPGMQINRFCASGLEAVNTAAMRVRSGWERLVVAGGVESMSRVAIGSDGGALMDDPVVAAQVGFVPQGISADLIATLEGFSRGELDRYALRSQQRAAQARSEGRFTSLVPVCSDDGSVVLDYDEHMRPGTTLDGLSQLPPAFAQMGVEGFDAIALARYPQAGGIEHVHTAGNSSGIVDGAAVVLIGSREAGAAGGWQPRARVVAAALVGDEPTIMLTGPAPAARRALAKAAMVMADIDLVECNEAFAAVVLKFQREMGLEDSEKVNVNGGAIALGHPLGATGAMLLMTALDELERRDENTALITLCAGGGMGIATIIERV